MQIAADVQETEEWKMPVEFRKDKDTLTVSLSGEIDHHSAAEIRIMTDGELERATPRTLVFDMSGVTFMDSSGIGLILGRARTMQAWGGKIRIIHPSERAAKILKLSGLGALIAEKSGKKGAGENA